MHTARLTPEGIEKLRAALPLMPEKQKRQTAELLKRYNEEMAREAGRESFLDFILHVYPGYKFGPHHLKLIDIFESIARGERKRVIVNIAPRHGKSELISYLAPAWFLGKYPQKKVIMASHTADLAVNFGRRVRNLVGSELYRDIFPNVELQADSKSASRWGTNFNGEYFAIGVGGALAGRGADLFIIDDPHSEQEAKQGKSEVFEPAWEWFQSGPVQRLMPGGAIIIVMTRWSKLDLTGRVIDHMLKNDDADEWEVVEFPAILDSGEPLWPEYWKLDELEKMTAVGFCGAKSVTVTGVSRAGKEKSATVSGADVRRLLPAEIGDVNRLYQLGFAAWLPSTAIAEGVYYGIRVGGRLVAAAGTHVVSETARLAGLRVALGAVVVEQRLRVGTRGRLGLAAPEQHAQAREQSVSSETPAEHQIASGRNGVGRILTTWPAGARPRAVARSHRLT